MKKLLKRLGAGVMAVAMMLALIGVMPQEAKAEGTPSMEFDDEYFYHTGRSWGTFASFEAQNFTPTSLDIGLYKGSVKEESVDFTWEKTAGSKNNIYRIKFESGKNSAELTPAGEYTFKVVAHYEDGGDKTVTYEHKAYIYEEIFTPVAGGRDYINIKAGTVVTDKVLGSFEVRYGPDVTYTAKVINWSDVEHADPDSAQGITAKIVNRNQISISTTAAAKVGDYVVRLDGLLTSGSGILLYPVSVYITEDGGGSTSNEIDNVRINVPSSLAIGAKIDELVADFASVSSGEHYEIAPPVTVWPHDKNGNEVFDPEETTIKQDMIYRVNVELRAKGDYVFKESNVKDSVFTDCYIFDGRISSSANVLRKFVSNGGKNLTIVFQYSTVKSSGGGGTSSGSRPTTPAAPEDTIPVSGNSTSSVDVSVSGDTATVGEISQATINSTTGGIADTNVTLDLSSKEGVSTATIPTESIERVADNVNNASSNAKALEIKFSEGSIVLDGEALSAIANAAGGNVSISIKTVITSNLNESQQNAIAGQGVVTTVSVTITSGNNEISSLGRGSQTVSVNHRLSAGQRGNNFHAFHLAPNGTMRRQQTRYANGQLSFTTNHNSDYVVVYDESLNNEDYSDVYRAFNPANGDHLITTSKAEYDNVVKLGWQAEGMVFNVFKSGGASVYRLFNPNTGEHLYTTGIAERDSLVATGWNSEGATFASTGAVPVYRVFNPNLPSNNHLYTKSKAECDILQKSGWKTEGIAFNVE